MKVNVKPDEGVVLPQYVHPGEDAGMDLRANITEPVIIRPGCNVLISTGIHAALPLGYFVNIKTRSGLAKKLIIAAEGTIDSGYRGDWMVNLINLGNEPFKVNPGERIAQAVLMKYEVIDWNVVDTLEGSARGESGFGMSGIK